MNSGQVSFSEANLATLRAQYLATGNPVYVWWAIHWCRNEHPQSLIPDWCLDYLGEVAQELIVMGQNGDPNSLVGRGSQRAPQTPKRAKILEVLGFTKKGKNAFKDASSEMRKVRSCTQVLFAATP